MSRLREFFLIEALNADTRAMAPRADTGSEGLLDVRLLSVRAVARDIRLFELGDPNGRRLPSAEAGSHIDLHLPTGAIRQYSILDPGRSPTVYAIAVKRDSLGRGGSVYMHDASRVGQPFKISLPRNNFPLVEGAPHSVLIAGGIGITPLYAMVGRLTALGAPWNLHYACRSRPDAAFHEELVLHPSVRFHFDDEADGRVLDVRRIVSEAPCDSHFYCCGPLPMLQSFERETLGMPDCRVHREYFASPRPSGESGGFVVELARSGKTFEVPPGSSILSVLLEAGMDVAHSCEVGICGSCETRVIEGIPEHRDAILTEAEKAENKSVMICCAGSRSPKLVLDL